MKRTVLLALSSFVLLSACAKDKTPKVAAPKPAAKAYTVNLYQHPNHDAKVLETVSVRQPLISIFHKKGWEKVANRKNGQVGWVDVKSYRKAWHQAMQPDVQMVYVQTEKTTQGKKPKMTIVAYRNGKKVSDKEAKRIYKRFRKQQRQQAKQWRAFNRQMNREFRQMNANFAPMWPAPVIVIQR